MPAIWKQITFSQSSPQLAELIRQTAGVGLMTAEPAMNLTEPSMPVDVTTQVKEIQQHPISQPSPTSNLPSISAGTEINSTENHSLAFLSNLDQPSVGAQTPIQIWMPNSYPAFSQLAQLFQPVKISLWFPMERLQKSDQRTKSRR